MSRARIIDAEHLNLRVLKVIDIASLLGSDAFEMDTPDDFDDFRQCLSYKTHASVEEIARVLATADDELELEPDDIHTRLYRRELFGLLLQVGTPIRKHASENSWRSSWGHLYTGWVYGNTYDEAWEQAKSWAEERHAADLSKFMEGGAA